MILPENGSVVIIDDDPNQAKPIIDALAKRGISTTYFKGTGENEIPNEPLKNVRLAILDLQLNTMDRDAHTIATRLVNVLNKVISDDNGPFMVLTWSLKDNLFGEEFRNEVMKQDNQRVPVCIATLEKSECLQRLQENIVEELAGSVIKELKTLFDENDLEQIKSAILKNSNEDMYYEATPDAFEKIEESLKGALEKAGVFHLFVIWENLIRRAGYRMVNHVASTIEYNELWEGNMRDVLKRLAKAISGKNTLTDNLLLKKALSIFSGSYSEELENEIRKFEFPDYINPNTEFSIAGKLNNDTYEIVLYITEQNGLRVKLVKEKTVFMGKENIRIDRMESLSDGLVGEEKSFIEDLVRRYQNIPLLINTKLHIDLNPSDELMPGNVYKIDVPDEQKKELLETYFDSIPENLTDFYFIELEVSPVCDYAQSKWKKSRLVSGLVYPVSAKLKSGEYFYSNCPEIILNEQNYRMAFCYLLFKSHDVKEIEKRGKSWFRIKRELLQDIVAGLSSHVNRPGITTVN